MNNKDREMWIDNDEGLYNWWRRSKLNKRNFIKENRENVLNGKKPVHYLTYGG